MWYEGAYLYYRFYRFLIIRPLVFCWWFMSNIRNVFTKLVLSCNKVRLCWHSEEIQPTDVCKANVLKSSYRKIWSNISNQADEEQVWSDKMNKEQSADDPSVDSIRVKNMLNSTISMSYPDVVIACRKMAVSLKHSEQLRQRWWSTIIIWRIIPLVVDWSP